LDSGIEIGGILTEIESDHSNIDFFKFKGPCQIGAYGKELDGQGIAHHPHGFSAPIGFWRKKVGEAPHHFSESCLRELGIIRAQKARLEFASGFVVTGVVKDIVRSEDHKLQIISWTDCTVSRNDKVYFEPDWGVFDMPVGSSVTSVFSGPPDRDSYGSYEIGIASSSPGRTSAFTDREQSLFNAYSLTRKLRRSVTTPGTSLTDELNQLTRLFGDQFANEWLLGLELIELHKRVNAPNSTAIADISALVHHSLNSRHQSEADLFIKGLKLASVDD
jgi:phenylalanine-4-hydroxylase